VEGPGSHAGVSPRNPRSRAGSDTQVSRLLQQILADDELIDAIAAGQIPYQRGARLAEVLAQIRSALLAGELTLVAMDPPGGVPDRANAPDEDDTAPGNVG
jgi:hypothetical protein